MFPSTALRAAWARVRSLPTLTVNRAPGPYRVPSLRSALRALDWPRTLLRTRQLREAAQACGRRTVGGVGHPDRVGKRTGTRTSAIETSRAWKAKQARRRAAEEARWARLAGPVEVRVSVIQTADDDDKRRVAADVPHQPPQSA